MAMLVRGSGSGGGRWWFGVLGCGTVWYMVMLVGGGGSAGRWWWWWFGVLGVGYSRTHESDA